MKVSLVSMPVRALRGGPISDALAVLPASAAATSSPEEVDTAVGKAVKYVQGQQDPLTGEPFGFEHGSFSSDWVATSLAAAGVSAADVGTAGNPRLQDFLFDDYDRFLDRRPTDETVTNYERAPWSPTRPASTRRGSRPT